MESEQLFGWRSGGVLAGQEMNDATKIRRRTGIMAATAMRDLAHFRYAAPVSPNRFASREACAECGCKISEGRENRRCFECRRGRK